MKSTKLIWDFIGRYWLIVAIVLFFSVVMYNNYFPHNNTETKFTEMSREEFEYLVILHAIISNDSLVAESCIRRANTFYKVYKERAKLD